MARRRRSRRRSNEQAVIALLAVAGLALAFLLWALAVFARYGLPALGAVAVAVLLADGAAYAWARMHGRPPAGLRFTRFLLRTVLTWARRGWRMVRGRVAPGRPAPVRVGQVRREPIPERVRHEVWRRDGGRCVDCGSRERLEYDHIVAVVNGGSNTARNIELRCETCNRKKGARI